MKIFLINAISIFGYLIIGVFSPLLWYQGMRLKREVPRLPTPGDRPFGICKGKDKEFNILGLGESPMAGVGITKNSFTLTGLTAENADLVLVSMGGNDVFQLTPPWVWKNNINTCVKLLFQNYKNPLILFSPLPPVGRFPAIPNPLRIVFGFWEFLLQASLAQAINSLENAHLLDERYPDGKEYYLEDGIHPSPLAYDPWSEKLAIMTVELLNQIKNGNI